MYLPLLRKHNKRVKMTSCLHFMKNKIRSCLFYNRSHIKVHVQYYFFLKPKKELSQKNFQKNNNIKNIK